MILVALTFVLLKIAMRTQNMFVSIATKDIVKNI